MENRKKSLVIARVTILITAGAFICYGIFRGEAGIVLDKAINICFECIGLG